MVKHVFICNPVGFINVVHRPLAMHVGYNERAGFDHANPLQINKQLLQILMTLYG